MLLTNPLLSLILLTTLTHSFPLATVQEQAYVCNTGAHIFGARATGTTYNHTSIDGFGYNLAAYLNNSQYVPLPYPATEANYFSSVSTGVGELSRRVIRYMDNCPDGRVVLMGYSQGAQVVADVLIGRSNTSGRGLPEQYRQNIIAIVQFGDPTFHPYLSFDVGNATRNGIIPRTNYEQYQTYGLAPKIQSYCNANDSVCDSGLSQEVHDTYLERYADAAETFIVDAVHATTQGE